ncbi:hypothetical protein F0243_27405 [Vibrio mediterranei]|nr:hypothetical protein [Vibrio mediterranei]
MDENNSVFCSDYVLINQCIPQKTCQIKHRYYVKTQSTSKQSQALQQQSF